MTGLVRAPAAPKRRRERRSADAHVPSLQEVDTCAIIEIACIVTDGNLVRARAAPRSRCAGADFGRRSACLKVQTW